MQAFRLRAATAAVAAIALLAGGCGADGAEEMGTELPGDFPGMPTAATPGP